MIRPGPPWIARETYPGGYVVQGYTATDPPMLLFTTLLRDDGERLIEDQAETDGARVRRILAADAPVVLVAYDGDTGERQTPEQWANEQ